MEFIIGGGIIAAAILLAALGLRRRERGDDARKYGRRKTINEIAADHTTQLPLPPNADSCSHDWDLVTSHVLDDRRSVTVMKCPTCGAIDKTVEEVEPPEPEQQPKSECRHKWLKEKYVVLSSAYEQMATAADKHNRSVYSYRTSGRNKETAPAWKTQELELKPENKWAFEKKFVQVRVCSQCGEIDKIITSNYSATEEHNADG
tara:strand:- start:2038 stop:2649 length:612 start_codon:yes stop_codon:yes gene_type:complete